MAVSLYCSVKNLCAWVICCLCVLACGAELTPALAQNTATQFATVWRIRGDVTATPIVAEAETPRRLAMGEPVFVGERLRADTVGEMVLKTADGGWLAVRPGAAFVVERFAAEGNASDHATVRVLEGGLRLITGWIGRLNRRDYRVVTPTATIGIRGTDHEPYVLNASLAQTLAQPEGTYDKVNRGATTLETNGNSVDLDAGSVGFARAAKPVKTRALITLLLPVLLEKVPDFFVAGQFDAELDQLSASADDSITRELAERRKMPKCDAKAVAVAWLRKLDRSIVRRDAGTVLQLFAPEVVVRATVRQQDGSQATVELGRDEFAQSTVAAVKALTAYKQRRLTIDAQPLPGGHCERIQVTSTVVEQGKQNGKAYRVESTEVYGLERQSGQWLAVSATTTQR
ncbi:MAG: hypothetical protein V4858_22400 [Pseudomonadota bacterium]